MPEIMSGYKPSPEDMMTDEKRKEIDSAGRENLNLDGIEISTIGERNQKAYDLAKKELSEFVKTSQKIDDIYQSGELSGNVSMLSAQKVSSRINKELNKDKIKELFQTIYDLNDDRRREKNYGEEYTDDKTGFKEKKYDQEQTDSINWYNNAVDDMKRAIDDYTGGYPKRTVNITLPSKLDMPKVMHID